ncbi:MAG TPA: ribose-5-phosphate isomerase RpiA [Gemmatimonadales bacterium]|nr:ribose-5-phosphate isomerase RpiA [Gemmatimonadales bacterium]
MMTDLAEPLKRQAAERAAEFVESGMVVGLGTGSTAVYAVRRIGEWLRTGERRDLHCVATSAATEALALRLGIPLLDPWDGARHIDLTIDGADEVDPDLNLIKGGGGALLREKVVAQASRREMIVVDESKLSPRLGSRHMVPVEVLPFGWETQVTFLEEEGARVSFRTADRGLPFQSDQGNFILDCDWGPIADPAALARRLGTRAGIVDHGLFLCLATDLIVAGASGVTHRTRS